MNSVTVKGAGFVQGRVLTVDIGSSGYVEVEDGNVTVRCRISQKLQPILAGLAGKPVRLYGCRVSSRDDSGWKTIKFTACDDFDVLDDSPLTEVVEEIRGTYQQLPTIKEMSGLVDDMCEGKSLKEYMDYLRDDD
jgi:hypothetical protein